MKDKPVRIDYQDEYGSWWRPMKDGTRTRVIHKTCTLCGDRYLSVPSVTSKTCSKSCAAKLVNRPKKALRQNTCSWCGGEFKAYARYRTYCSRPCYHAARTTGKHTRNRGHYTQVRVRTDDSIGWPMANAQGWVGEHRLVVARKVGRPLSSEQTVHHINGDRHDNRIENLELRTGNHGAGQRYVCLCCGSENVTAVRLNSNDKEQHARRSSGRPGDHSRQSTGRTARVAA